MNLIERLRDPNPKDQWCSEGGLFFEAADEIERLNAIIKPSERHWAELTNELTDKLQRLTAELAKRDASCQDCPTFLEQDAIIEHLRAALIDLYEYAINNCEDAPESNRLVLELNALQDKEPEESMGRCRVCGFPVSHGFQYCLEHEPQDKEPECEHVWLHDRQQLSTKANCCVLCGEPK